MTNQINSFEQNAAALETLLALKQFPAGPKRLAAAETAKAVASIFEDFASGNSTSINTEINSLLSGITDAGVKVVATNLAALAEPYIANEIAVVQGMPGVGLMVDAGLSAAAAGINQVADAYIAAETKAAATKAAAAQPPGA